MPRQDESKTKYQAAETDFDSPDRRTFLRTSSMAAVAGATALSWPHALRAAAGDLDAIAAEIPKRHDECQRLQKWIRQPSIAAENRGMNEGCELTMQCCGRPASAGHQGSHRRPARYFRHLDAGARRPSASISCTTSNRPIPRNGRRHHLTPLWSTSPASARSVMGRGAVNQKGPESTFIAALHAIRGAGQKAPGEPRSRRRR